MVLIFLVIGIGYMLGHVRIAGIAVGPSIGVLLTGLQIAGIVIGYVSSIYPTFGRVPAAARHVLMQLGFMLFMATIAVTAGGGFVAGLLEAGPTIIAGGALVTMVPVLVGYLFGSRVLKMNPVLLLGSITGAMTSTSAMQIISEAARSPTPSLGYAGTYAFANVLLTFAGAFMMLV
jgi:putative transport protein